MMMRSIQRKGIVIMMCVITVFLLASCKDKETVSNHTKKETKVSTTQKETTKKPVETSDEIEKKTVETKSSKEVDTMEVVDYSEYQGKYVRNLEDIYKYSSMHDFLGAIGVSIESIDTNYIKGQVFNIQEMPNYRNSFVQFEGYIDREGNFTYDYYDRDWSIDGSIKLYFHDGIIELQSIYNKTNNDSMGVGQGKFLLVPEILTETIPLNGEIAKEINNTVKVINTLTIQTFQKDSLTDGQIREFVINNIAEGLISTSDYEQTVVNEGNILFPDTYVDQIANQYFGKESISHGPIMPYVDYIDHHYHIGVRVHEIPKAKIQYIAKDFDNPSLFYVVVDYMDSEEMTIDNRWLIELIRVEEGHPHFLIQEIKGMNQEIDFALVQTVIEHSQVHDLNMENIDFEVIHYDKTIIGEEIPEPFTELYLKYTLDGQNYSVFLGDYMGHGEVFDEFNLQDYNTRNTKADGVYSSVYLDTYYTISYRIFDGKIYVYCREFEIATMDTAEAKLLTIIDPKFNTTHSEFTPTLSKYIFEEEEYNLYDPKPTVEIGKIGYAGEYDYAELNTASIRVETVIDDRIKVEEFELFKSLTDIEIIDAPDAINPPNNTIITLRSINYYEEVDYYFVVKNSKSFFQVYHRRSGGGYTTENVLYNIYVFK